MVTMRKEYLVNEVSYPNPFDNSSSPLSFAAFFLFPVWFFCELSNLLFGYSSFGVNPRLVLASLTGTDRPRASDRSSNFGGLVLLSPPLIRKQGKAQRYEKVHRAGEK